MPGKRIRVFKNHLCTTKGEKEKRIYKILKENYSSIIEEYSVCSQELAIAVTNERRLAVAKEFNLNPRCHLYCHLL